MSKVFKPKENQALVRRAKTDQIAAAIGNKFIKHDDYA